MILKIIVATEQEKLALDRFWNFESIGIMPYESEDEDNEFVKSYKESLIHLADGRFSAKLPWEPSHPPFPTKKAIARRRTRSTVRRPESDP